MRENIVHMSQRNVQKICFAGKIEGLLLQEKLCFFKNDFLNFKIYVDCITGLHHWIASGTM